MSDATALYLQPDWAAPKRVRALATTRHAGDMANPTVAGELTKADWLPSAPRWLTQVHGPLVVNADDADTAAEADSAWTGTHGVVCGVLTADCLPVLFCDRQGRYVAAAHAGWRGLCSGVLDLTVQRFFELDVPPEEIIVWLGPAIGPAAYEVDTRVRDAFLARDPDCVDSFAVAGTDHWKFDLYAAARTVLAAQGVVNVSGGGFCTHDDQRFYSYRRDPHCGRQATLIWLDPLPLPN